MSLDSGAVDHPVEISAAPSQSIHTASRCETTIKAKIIDCSPEAFIEMLLQSRKNHAGHCSLSTSENLIPSSQDSNKLYHFIDTRSTIAYMVDSLISLPTIPPSLYLDLEGVNLGRNGSISILQIFVLPKHCTYLLDIHVLGLEAFSTPGKNGETLKSILESGTIPKVFFDVRNDSDALFSHFDVRLAGVQDLQVMEFATRRRPGRFVCSLAKCVDLDLKMTGTERENWQATKSRGKELFAPAWRGSFDILNVRPLSEELCAYCVQDVEYLPQLWVHYISRLNSTSVGLTAVEDAVEKRLLLSRSDAFNGNGRHMAIGPW